MSSLAMPDDEDPRQSVGRPILTSRVRWPKKAWFARGPALAKFQSEVQPFVEHVLKNLDTSYEDVFLRLYMIGRKVERAKPFVAICCTVISVLPDIEHCIRTNGFETRFPGFRLGVSALPLETQVAIRLIADNDRCWNMGSPIADDELEPLKIYSMSSTHIWKSGGNTYGAPTLGARMEISGDESASYPSSRSTGGVVLHDGQHYVQMTVRHLWDNANFPQQHHESIEDPEYCRFEEQDEEDKLEFEMMSQASQSSSGTMSPATNSDGLFTSTSCSPNPEQLHHREQSVGTELGFLAHHQPQRFREIASQSQSSSKKDVREFLRTDAMPKALVGTLERQLDSDALLALDVSLIQLVDQGRKGMDNVNQFTIDTRTISIKTSATVPGHETAIVAITGSAGPCHGLLLPDPISYRSANGVIHMYQVQLQGEVVVGDSGSAVVDAASGNWLGQIILGAPGTSTAYMVPATDIMSALQQAHGDEFALASTTSANRSQYRTLAKSTTDIISAAQSPASWDRKHQRLTKSFRFDQISAHHMSTKGAYGETCKWVLESTEFHHWLDLGKRHEHHGVLWMKGKPGAGKSTLMKFAHSSLQWQDYNQDIITSFFYHAQEDRVERSIDGIYRSSLFPLFKKVPRLQGLLDLIESQGAAPIWYVDKLKLLLQCAVQALGQESLVLVIDALDECNPGEVFFLEDLGRLASDPKLKPWHYPWNSKMFDGKFVNVSRDSAAFATMDPQSRRMTQMAYEASEQAGFDVKHITSQFGSELSPLRKSQQAVWVVFCGHGRELHLHHSFSSIARDRHELTYSPLVRIRHRPRKESIVRFYHGGGLQLNGHMEMKQNQQATKIPLSLPNSSVAHFVRWIPARSVGIIAVHEFLAMAAGYKGNVTQYVYEHMVVVDQRGLSVSTESSSYRSHELDDLRFCIEYMTLDAIKADLVRHFTQHLSGGRFLFLYGHDYIPGLPMALCICACHGHPWLPQGTKRIQYTNLLIYPTLFGEPSSDECLH